MMTSTNLLGAAAMTGVVLFQLVANGQENVRNSTALLLPGIDSQSIGAFKLAGFRQSDVPVFMP